MSGSFENAELQEGEMRIAVDTLGFDGPPGEAVRGALEALTAFLSAEVSASRAGGAPEIVLLGDAEFLEREILACFRSLGLMEADRLHGLVRSRLRTRHCPDVILPGDPPVKAIRAKAASSLVAGLQMLKQREVDAFVSAGNTGALVAGGMLTLGKLPGVDRPALAVMLPTLGRRPTVLVDAGANTEVKAKNLVQFAVMGSTFAEKVMGFHEPSVGLLNVGTEPEKGTSATKEAYQGLKSAPINFVGNVEARDLPMGIVDVIVCDGFVGNVLLKYTEGVGLGLLSLLGRGNGEDASPKIVPLFASDYRQYGGAPLLGLDGIVIKCHGASDARAFAKAISIAQRHVSGGLVGALAEKLTALNGDGAGS